MAQERSDVEKFDRVDPADYSLSEMHGARGAAANNAVEPQASEGEAWRAADGKADLTTETENIKGQIKETRHQMGETIDAIQDKLSFSNISEQVSDHVHNAVETAKEAVYDATIGKAAGIMKNVTNDISNSSIVKTAKDNPLPFVLIGLGAGLLAYKSYSGTLTPRSKRHEFTGYQDRTFDSQTSMAESARGTLDDITEKVSTSAGNAMDKVTGALDSAYTGAGDVMDRASVKAHDLKNAAVQHYESHLDKNPLALGAAALAFGAAVGMAIPATKYEGQLLGETRNDFLDKAQNSAVGLLDKTKRALVEGKHPIAGQKASTIEH